MWKCKPNKFFPLQLAFSQGVLSQQKKPYRIQKLVQLSWYVAVTNLTILFWGGLWKDLGIFGLETPCKCKTLGEMFCSSLEDKNVETSEMREAWLGKFQREAKTLPRLLCEDSLWYLVSWS